MARPRIENTLIHKQGMHLWRVKDETTEGMVDFLQWVGSPSGPSSLRFHYYQYSTMLAPYERYYKVEPYKRVSGLCNTAPLRDLVILYHETFHLPCSCCFHMRHCSRTLSNGYPGITDVP